MEKNIGDDLIFFGNDFDSSYKKSKAEDIEKKLIKLLKLISPGTAIRIALDDIMRARMGALIVMNKEGFLNIVDGGFRVNCKFSPQRLVELAKMDGAIVLSEDLKKIFYANTLLVPNMKVSTRETGTRHKAAERTSKQMDTLVVAVSERKHKITAYWGDVKYILEESSEILRRAAETLQILEKQKEISENALSELNILEINDLVTSNDVCGVLQKQETVRRISDKVRRYLVELGKEGIIVSMRLRDLTKDLNKERGDVLEDYFGSGKIRTERILSSLNFDDVLDVSELTKKLFGENRKNSILSLGFRILRKTDLEDKDIKLLINAFDNLEKVFDVSEEKLVEILGDRGLVLKKELEELREKILVGKKI